MHKILSIDHTQKKTAKDGRPYTITYATLDDGLECEGFGLDFKVGDEVESFHHWGKNKMRRPEWDNEPDSEPEVD